MGWGFIQLQIVQAGLMNMQIIDISSPPTRVVAWSGHSSTSYAKSKICPKPSRYCKCWEYPLWYDPLRFILSFSICYHHLLFFTELQTTTGSLKRLFFNWSFQFTHIEHFTFAFLKSRYCKRYPKMQNQNPPTGNSATIWPLSERAPCRKQWSFNPTTMQYAVFLVKIP